jgi:hypothetical protein
MASAVPRRHHFLGNAEVVHNFAETEGLHLLAPLFAAQIGISPLRLGRWREVLSWWDRGVCGKRGAEFMASVTLWEVTA